MEAFQIALKGGLYRMLHDLEGNVDRTESKLGDAMKKMQKFIRDTEGQSLYATLSKRKRPVC